MLFLQIKYKKCNIDKYNNSIIIQRVEIYLLKINKKRESFIETLTDQEYLRINLISMN